MDLALGDSSILVTGGSSGIGLGAAKLLLAEGARVTVCARGLDRLRRAERQLDSPRLLIHQADIYDPVAAAGAVEAALGHGGSLDGIAAVAGRGRHGSLLDLPGPVVVSEVANKLLGLLNVVKPALPALEHSRGCIVGLTAPTAALPIPAMGAVGVARAALDNAISALAVELAPRGIRVNAVGVGLIDSPRQRARHAESRSSTSYRGWLADQARQRSLPLQRPGTVDEVASAICWLLSARSSYTTGAVLDVTGGHRSR